MASSTLGASPSQDTNLEANGKQDISNQTLFSDEEVEGDTSTNIDTETPAKGKPPAEPVEAPGTAASNISGVYRTPYKAHEPILGVHDSPGVLSQAVSRANTPVLTTAPRVVAQPAQGQVSSILGRVIGPPSVASSESLGARLLTHLNPGMVPSATPTHTLNSGFVGSGCGSNNTTSSSALPSVTNLPSAATHTPQAASSGLMTLAEAAAQVERANVEAPSRQQSGTDQGPDTSNSPALSSDAVALLKALTTNRPDTPNPRSVSPHRPTPSPITPPVTRPEHVNPPLPGADALRNDPTGFRGRTVEQYESFSTADDHLQTHMHLINEDAIAPKIHDTYIIKTVATIKCDVCSTKNSKDGEVYQCEACTAQICRQCVEEKLEEERSLKSFVGKVKDAKYDAVGGTGFSREPDDDDTAGVDLDEDEHEASDAEGEKTRPTHMGSDFEWQGRRQHLPFKLCYLDRKNLTGIDKGPHGCVVNVPNHECTMVKVAARLINDTKKGPFGKDPDGKKPVSEEQRKALLKMATANTTTQAFQAFGAKMKKDKADLTAREVEKLERKKAKRREYERGKTKGTKQQPIDVDFDLDERDANEQVQDEIFGKDGGRGARLKAIQEAARTGVPMPPRPQPPPPRPFQNVGGTDYDVPRPQPMPEMREEVILRSQRHEPEPQGDEESADEEVVPGEDVTQGQTSHHGEEGVTRARASSEATGRRQRLANQQQIRDMNAARMREQQEAQQEQLRQQHLQQRFSEQQQAQAVAAAQQQAQLAQQFVHNDRQQAPRGYLPLLGHVYGQTVVVGYQIDPRPQNYQQGAYGEQPSHGQQLPPTQPQVPRFNVPAPVEYGLTGPFGRSQPAMFSVGTQGPVDHFAQIDREEGRQVPNRIHGRDLDQELTAEERAQQQRQEIAANGQHMQQMAAMEYRRQQGMRQAATNQTQQQQAANNRAQHQHQQGAQHPQGFMPTQGPPAYIPYDPVSLIGVPDNRIRPPPVAPNMLPYVPLPSIDGTNIMAHPGIYFNETRDIMPGFAHTFIEQIPAANGTPLSVDNAHPYLNWIMGTEQGRPRQIAATEARSAHMVIGARNQNIGRRQPRTGPVETIVIDSDSEPEVVGDTNGEGAGARAGSRPAPLNVRRQRDNRSRSPARDEPTVTETRARDRFDIVDRATPDDSNNVSPAARPFARRDQPRPKTSRFADASLHAHPMPQPPAQYTSHPQPGSAQRLYNPVPDDELHRVGTRDYHFNFPLLPNTPQYAPETFELPEYITGLDPNREPGGMAGLPIRYAYAVGRVDPRVFGANVGRVIIPPGGSGERRNVNQAGGVLRNINRSKSAPTPAPAAADADGVSEAVEAQSDGDRMDILAAAADVAAEEVQNDLGSNVSGDTELLSDEIRAIDDDELMKGVDDSDEGSECSGMAEDETSPSPDVGKVGLGLMPKSLTRSGREF